MPNPTPTPAPVTAQANLDSWELSKRIITELDNFTMLQYGEGLPTGETKHMATMMRIVMNLIDAALAAAAETARREQMEADCKAVCNSCEAGRPIEYNMQTKHWEHTEGLPRCDAHYIRAADNPGVVNALLDTIRFYADEDNYKCDTVDIGVGAMEIPGSSAVALDAGQRARAAIRGAGKE